MHEEGATLAELAVAMLVTTLVLGACYGSYLFATRALSAWRAQSRQTSETYLLERQLARDFRSAAHAAFTEETTGEQHLVLLGARRDTLAVYFTRQDQNRQEQLWRVRYGPGHFGRGNDLNASLRQASGSRATSMGRARFAGVTASSNGLVRAELVIARPPGKRLRGDAPDPRREPERLVVIAAMRQAPLAAWYDLEDERAFSATSQTP